ncbi:MAG: FG-GAP-like repeat-containing protein [Desulfocucumaceae bacterium]
MKKNKFMLAVLVSTIVFFSVVNAGVWEESTQADFSDGLYDVNVFTTYSGEIKCQQDGIYDLNDDGNPDIVVCNLNGPVYVYWGSEDGYSTVNRTSLNFYGATGNSIADLNNDGYLDLVFSKYDGSGSGDAVIYWGSADNYSDSHITLLPTLGSHGNYIADLNDDKHLDIIFANYGSGSYHDVNSYIYWGGPAGYSATARTELPTHGGISCSVADLNNDGRLDIVFSNRQTAYITVNIHSYIYWGHADGYSTAHMDSLYTEGAYGNAIADLNKDGNLDIVFCNHYNGSYECNSYIYWGDSTGHFDEINKTELPTLSGNSVGIADLNLDGWLDLAFANWKNDATYDVNSYIYWGSPTGFAPANRTELPVYEGTGVMIGKVTNNGTSGGGKYPDVVFTGYSNTYVYFGGPEGFSDTNRTLLPSLYGHLSTKNIGNVCNRGPQESYGSSVFDAGQEVTWTELSHTGTIPDGTSIDCYIRTGNTAVPDETWGEWVKITSAKNRLTSSALPKSMTSRYVQYKMDYNTSVIYAPKTESVSINYDALGVTEEQGYGAPEALSMTLGPTPFVKKLFIKCNLDRAGSYRLKIYNVNGQLVKNYSFTTTGSGKQTVAWDGNDQNNKAVSAGAYICQLEGPDRILTRKAVKIK